MEEDLKCLHCSYVAPRVVRLKRHMEVKHQGLRQACNICSYTCTESCNLKKHIQRVHEGVKDFHGGLPKPHRLGECNRMKIDKKCKQCGFISDNQDIQKLHALSHQISPGDIMNNLPLSIKEASFEDENEFLSDLKGFLENFPSIKTKFDSLVSNLRECEECGKLLHSDSLRKHRRQIHRKPPSLKSEHDASASNYAKVECAKCKKCSQPKNLKRHERQFHGEPTSFKSDQEEMPHNGTISQLSKHLLNHTKVKIHTCSECNKSFADGYRLKRHMITHSGEKVHKCPVCGNSFGLASHLKEHKLTHSGEKPHKCMHCDYAFLRASDLRVHIRRHLSSSLKSKHDALGSNYAKVKCGKCDKFFHPKSSRRHETRVHGEMPRIQCESSLPIQIRSVQSESEMKQENMSC